MPCTEGAGMGFLEACLCRKSWVVVSRLCVRVAADLHMQSVLVAQCSQHCLTVAETNAVLRHPLGNRVAKT